jgi:heat shock protein HtpX
MNPRFVAQKRANITKTWMLMSVFFIGIIGLGYVLTQYTGNPTFLYGGALMSVMMNLFAYFKSDTIAISSSGAVPADPVQYADLHEIVGRLAAQMQLPKPKVYIINDSAPNAFATGRNPEHASVAATTGIIERLSKQELEGVMAHELSHVQNRDILVMTVAVVLAGVVSIVADMFMRMSLFGGNRRQEGNGGPLVLLATIMALVIAPLAAQLIQLAISRKREYLADASAVLVTGNPEGLATALEKIASYAAPMHRASHATAHLFISNPFGSYEVGKSFATLFATHPPMEDRIAILRNLPR